MPKNRYLKVKLGKERTITYRSMGLVVKRAVAVFGKTKVIITFETLETHQNNYVKKNLHF